MTADRQPAAGPDDQSLAIHARDASPNTDPIEVRVTGADPGAAVEFSSSLEDADGDEFTARATFTADDDGVADLTEHAPDDGDWDDAHPMAWLWAMTSDGDAPFARLSGVQRLEVTLRAETDDAETDRTITRVLHDDDIERRDVDADGVVGTLYLPAGDGPHPGVLELHGSGGRRSDGTARLLASQGYAALALTYFDEAHDGLPDELERVPLSYFDDAAAWLRDRPEVRDGRVGVVGASRGAEAALLLGAHYGWPGAVVSYSGSVPWDTPSDEPAWLRDGDPVPHITAEEAPRFADLDEKPVADVVPPVETTNGPVLLLSGGDDRVWDSWRLSEAIAERLRERDFEHRFDHRTYEDCGHLVGTPYAPLGGLDETDRAGGTARGTVRASEDAWPAVLNALEDGLQTKR
ncbi:acyl-CoA thioester hydrolase/BAAT C-terminal domain-containing protein [Halobacterium yunchengense]|uniref:acyl-CoA thioester hydrolase/BAAT C-terminal domain-containing protein n=1 Tax=Halobacterium yunchengense TaxID=3108497 RepID=UPI00300A9325